MRRITRATAFLLGLLLAAVLPAAALAEEGTGIEPVWDTSRQTAPLREAMRALTGRPFADDDEAYLQVQMDERGSVNCHWPPPL